MINTKPWKIIISIIFIIAVIIIVFCMSSNVRYSLSDNPIGYRVLANWHSLRKSLNIAHLPYWFKKTDIKIYHINIGFNNLIELNQNIPFNKDTMSYGSLRDEQKHYVGANFERPSINYKSKIKIRYRGVNRNNWDGEKKAFRIKFSSDSLFEGKSALNLFIPYDRAYFGEILASYRANKLGLFTSGFELVRVFINGRDYGVYFSSEPWTKELLAKNNILDSNNIFSSQDSEGKNSQYSIFSEKRLKEWKSYTAEIENDNFEELDYLFQLLNRANDAEFYKQISELVDLDSMYKWHAINILAGSNHQSDRGNIVLLFKKETGKFSFIPWDVNLYDSSGYNFQDVNLLTKRILSNQEYYNNFLTFLSSYVQEEKNLADDLRYYDQLFNKYKVNFFQDQAKLDNDFMFLKKIKKYRQHVINNFNNAREITLNRETPYKDVVAVITTEKLASPKDHSFGYYERIFYGTDKFVGMYPYFKLTTEGDKLYLAKGNYLINDTIIIPRDTELEIQAGVNICFAPEASLISYSPVTAIGNEGQPITFSNCGDRREVWGVFGVINTENKVNKFSHIRVDSGSHAVVNGVLFTSQFSLHNTISEINNSIFENSQSDDSIHAIMGEVSLFDSTISQNSADGVDFDFINNSKISGCLFINDGQNDANGDAIDLSGGVNLTVSNNQISHYNDKCISVGERTVVSIEKNLIKGCNIGIAVKDQSMATVKNTIIFNNQTAGLAAYLKKSEYISGGHAKIENSVICNNRNNISTDRTSSYDIENSFVGDCDSVGDSSQLIERYNQIPEDLIRIFLEEI